MWVYCFADWQWPLVNQGRKVQPEGREQSGQGAAEGAPGEVIGTLILAEEAEQPSSPEQEIIDNQPLLDPEPDCEQSGTEAIVQDAEKDAVQNSPPERSTAAPIPVKGPRPALSARNPLILTPAVSGYPTIRHDRAGVWQLVAAQQSGSAARGALSSASRTPPPEAEAEPRSPRKGRLPLVSSVLLAPKMARPVPAPLPRELARGRRPARLRLRPRRGQRPPGLSMLLHLPRVARRPRRDRTVRASLPKLDPHERHPSPRESARSDSADLADRRPPQQSARVEEMEDPVAGSKSRFLVDAELQLVQQSLEARNCARKDVDNQSV